MIIAENISKFSEITLLAIHAALKAGDILRHGYGHAHTINEKEGVHNFVTEYDTKCENEIIAFLKKEGPKSNFLAEEKGSMNNNADLTWIIDPLDGTVNFAHHIPMFSTSIAAMEKNEILIGVVYQPMTHELFIAEKGKGSFLNGKKLNVTSTEDINKSILATGFPYNLYENPSHVIQHFVDVLKTGIPIRRIGCASIDLAYVAAGRFDGFWEVGLGPWDCAAGNLLIEEANGKITTWDKNTFNILEKKPILATNSHIHNQLSSILTKEYK